MNGQADFYAVLAMTFNVEYLAKACHEHYWHAIECRSDANRCSDPSWSEGNLIKLLDVRYDYRTTKCFRNRHKSPDKAAVLYDYKDVVDTLKAAIKYGNSHVLILPINAMASGHYKWLETAVNEAGRPLTLLKAIDIGKWAGKPCQASFLDAWFDPPGS